MTSDHSPYRSFRRFWWLRPGVLLPSAGLLVLSAPMVWWISTYESVAAVVMFVITYVCLLLIVVRMMRDTILEPHIRKHDHVLRQEASKLEMHRQRSQAALSGTERRMLERGEVTPVLDNWRIVPTLRSRHSFISDTVTCRIDPSARELQVRIHLAADWTFERRSEGARLLRETAEYLRLISSDEAARAFRPFVANVIVALYVLMESDGLQGTPTAVLSVFVPWTDLQRATGAVQPAFIPGDLRFAEGKPIEPHREIPPGSGAATK